MPFSKKTLRHLLSYFTYCTYSKTRSTVIKKIFSLFFSAPCLISSIEVRGLRHKRHFPLQQSPVISQAHPRGSPPRCRTPSVSAPRGTRQTAALASALRGNGLEPRIPLAGSSKLHGSQSDSSSLNSTQQQTPTRPPATSRPGHEHEHGGPRCRRAGLS